MYRSRIAGTGADLPEKLLTNHDLEKLVETSHDWIVQRTGIVNRHIVADGETTSDMCYRASKKAIESAGLKPEDIDMILVATVTGDYRMPGTSCILQSKLGCKNVMAFDISAACSGFLYGLSIADQFIRTGVYKNILVVGSESLSRMMNYKDRETCILFGDGAGAWVVQRTDQNDPNIIIGSHMHADGNLSELLWVPSGGSKRPFGPEVLNDGSYYMIMNGKEIFKNAVRTMAQSCHEVLSSTGVKPEEVDWLVPHQANVRILEAVADHFKFPMSKVACYIHETGNTSAASIPIAFDFAQKEGKIKRGQKILMTAFGSGLTSGSLLMQF